MGGTEETTEGQGEAANDRAAFEAASEGARLWLRAKQYGEGPMPCGSATMQWSRAGSRGVPGTATTLNSDNSLERWQQSKTPYFVGRQLQNA